MLAGFATRHPRAVLGVAAALALLAAVGAARVQKEDDLLVFLPTRDPDVRRFEAVSRRFGSLRVALVGLQVGEGHDVFEPDTIRKIGKASDAIRDLTGVDRVVSLTTLTDVVGSPDGAEVTPLVDGPPPDVASHDALKRRVLSRAHVVGTAVSFDARAALLLVFLAESRHDGNVAPTHVEESIREVARRELGGLSLTFGGAPFAGRDIYTEAQRDVWRLSPIALGILLLVVLFAFRDVVGVALTLASVAYALLLVIGAMGWLGERWTVATSTLPVILFASGSSYAVHVLGRYYLVRGSDDAPTAMQTAIGIVARPLAVAALTTSVGFFSFVATDVRPMRAFGIESGIGVLLCWLASLTLVPAVIALSPRRIVRPLELRWLGTALVGVWTFCGRHRVPVLAVLVGLGALLVPPMRRVKVRMEPRAFFAKGSEPERADRFLVEEFGGSTFVQIAVQGDFDEPASLRELAHLESYARSLEGVTQVQSIVEPLLLVSDAMGAGHRLPQTRGQATNLYFFLQGHPEVNALLSEDRHEALVHVRLAEHAHEIVAALEHHVAERLSLAHGWPSHAQVADELALVLARPGQAVPDAKALRKVADALALPPRDDAALDRRRDEVALAAVMAKDAPPLHASEKAAAELAIEKQSRGWREAWRRAAVTPDDVDLAADALARDLEALPRETALGRVVPALLEASGRLEVPLSVRTRVQRLADDLLPPPDAVTATRLSAEVAGEPILDRGFGRAVEHNQLVSLAIAIVAVFLFMLALFRKLSFTILSIAPALLTLVYLTGGMGLFGAHIDLGTSLVAGIATGAGADFAMHYLWYLRSESPEQVSRTVGPVMLVSVALVAVGFFVLGLGRSPVMHLFGGLAGGAMALSAVLSCLVLPAALGLRPPMRTGQDSIP